MPKHKLMARGQITIIIIIGLIIAAGIGLAVFLIPHGSAPASDKDPVSHVETCLRSAAFSGIELLGKQGMIYPKAYIASQDDKIAYYYFRGKSFFPEKKDLEEELAGHIRENIDLCIFDYKKNKFGITNSNLSDIDVRIGKDVLINARYIIRADETYEGRLTATIQTRLSELHALAEGIVDETMIDPEWINLDALSESDVNLRIVKVDKSTLIYILTAEDGLDDAPFSLRFGMKYK